jgi:mono/diheme cytochrome c family protein
VTRALAWCASVLVGIGLLGTAPVAAQVAGTMGGDPLAGSRIFGEKGCARCHAVNGIGGKVGPDLGRLVGSHSFFDLAAAIWNHLPRMAARMRELGIARPVLDGRDAGDLVAFLATLGYFDPPGNVKAGERLFTEKRCIACHQVRGVGGVIGPSLDAIAQSESPLSVAAAMWNHGPAMAEAMRQRRIERPTFKDAELSDLIAYLRTSAVAPVEGPVYVLPGRSDLGQRLFVQKRCVDCHGAAGRGGGIGPDLAQRGRERSLIGFAAAMWNKAPAMQEAMRARAIPVPALTPEEMADVVGYLYTLRYFAVPGDTRRGSEVARDRGCLGCHTVGGGRRPEDLTRARELDSAAGVLAALWNHSFLGRPGAPTRGFAELTSRDMADLVAYLGSLPRSPR